MKPRLIDTHAHIYADQFDSDREDMIERSLGSGVRKIFMPNIDHSTIDSMLEVELKYPKNCFAMMGLHPCSVNKSFEKELYEVETWLDKRKFIAIGETGIDLYWDKTFLAQQEEALRIQLRWAKQYKVPIVLHCRDSFEETIRIVEEESDPDLTGIFHCFTGTVADARRIVDLGFYIGLGGVSTFKNGGLDKVIPQLPIDYIILETDSPYLAPVPHRGKRNEPSYVELVAKKVAGYRQAYLDEIADKTTENALKVYKMNE